MRLTTVTRTGDPGNRVDIIFMGDGYTEAETDTYRAHMDGFTDYLFRSSTRTDPFHQYQNFFNIHYITTPSAQSGVDDPGNAITRDTALGATYRYGGVTDRLLYVDAGLTVAAMNAALDGTGIGPEMRLVTTNSSKYGGGGGYFAVYAGGNGSAHELALHELGHSFANLADEYSYGGRPTYTGAEPSSVNVTTDPSGAKWAHWLGHVDPVLGTVGAYEGGFYAQEGIYRPTENSKMRALGKAFDPIAKEAFVLEFYKHVDPLDAWTGRGGTMSLRDPLALSVVPVDPEVIDLEWSVNGAAAAGDTLTFTLADYSFGPGTYTISARAYDNSGLVRRDLDQTQQVVTWTVQITEPEPEAEADPVLLGGAGNDELRGTALRERLDGGAGDDRITTGGGGDLVIGGPGRDTVSYAWSDAAVVVDLSARKATLAGSAERDTLRGIENIGGSAQGDSLTGDARANTLHGFGGDDALFGGAGADLLGGGSGGDLLKGGDGRDILLGGAGDDALHGGDGRDTLHGRAGSDRLFGGAGGDMLTGSGGADHLRGGAGHDRLSGQGGEDQLHGGAGNDVIFGGRGDDRLFGHAGGDQLRGGMGRDLLQGGGGDDVLTGGHDGPSGDGAADHFVFLPRAAGGGGQDRITDFEDGRDLLDLTGFGFADFDTQIAALSQPEAAGLVLTFAPGHLVVIETLAFSDFGAADVLR